MVDTEFFCFNIMYHLLGPLASVMIKKFGCRVTQITGETCILLGFALSILSRHLWHAVALYSVLAGKSHS